MKKQATYSLDENILSQLRKMSEVTGVPQTRLLEKALTLYFSAWDKKRAHEEKEAIRKEEDYFRRLQEGSAFPRNEWECEE